MVKRKRKRQRLFRLPEGYDKTINFSIMMLALFGLLMITSASMGSVSGNFEALFKIMVKQGLFIIAGYLGMAIVSNLYTHERCKILIKALIVVTTIMLILPLGFKGAGGARAWIQIPGIDISIQPSEFAKISVILIMTTYLGDVKKKSITLKDLCKPPAISVFAFVLIVVLLQSDTGSGVIMFAIAAVLFLIPSHPTLKKAQRNVVILGILGVSAVIFLMTPAGKGFLQALPISSYKINRFLAASNPFLDRYNTGYQLIKGLTAFASGGVFGLGLGNSIQKYTNFPAANTDYILSVIVEELGIVGFLIIFSLYMAVIWRLIKHAYNSDCEKDQMVLMGVATILFVHSLFNIGGVTGLIPLTGVPLLLISSGGSSTMAFMMSVGFAQAVIAQKNKNN